MADIHSGRCLCGAVRFRVRGAPRWVAHCHCASCRRATGAPLTTYLGLALEQVEFDADGRRRYPSSSGVLRGFCAECGSPISYESTRWPGEIHLHVSAMDRPQRFSPQLHVYHGEHIAWLELNDALPRFRALGARGVEPESHGPLARSQRT